MGNVSSRHICAKRRRDTEPEEIKEAEVDFAEEALSGKQAQAWWLNSHMKKPVEVVLQSGKTIEGTLTEFDAKTLVIERDTGDHETVLVFKSAIQCLQDCSRNRRPSRSSLLGCSPDIASSTPPRHSWSRGPASADPARGVP